MEVKRRVSISVFHSIQTYRSICSYFSFKSNCWSCHTTFLLWICRRSTFVGFILPQFVNAYVWRVESIFSTSTATKGNRQCFIYITSKRPFVRIYNTSMYWMKRSFWSRHMWFSSKLPPIKRIFYTLHDIHTAIRRCVHSTHTGNVLTMEWWWWSWNSITLHRTWRATPSIRYSNESKKATKLLLWRYNSIGIGCYVRYSIAVYVIVKWWTALNFCVGNVVLTHVGFVFDCICCLLRQDNKKCCCFDRKHSPARRKQEHLHSKNHFFSQFVEDY